MANKSPISLAFTVFIILMVSFTAHAEEPGQFYVENIEVRGLKTIEGDELIYMLGLKSGEHISNNQVTEGIKRAFLKGIFNALSVDELEGKIVVTATERGLIGRVSVRSQMFSKRDILQVYGIDRGDYVTGEMLNDRAIAVEDYIRKKGYPECKVSYTVETMDSEGFLEIILDIHEGSPKLIQKVVVTGRPREEVTSRLRLQPGEVFDALLLKEDLKKLEDYYIKKGFIDPIIGPAEFLDGELIFRIQAGRRLDYTIKGNKVFPDKVIIDMMPFHDEGQINDDLLAEGIERVVDLYRSKGFSDVQIAPVVKSRENVIEVRVYINEGSIKTVSSFNVIKDGEIAKEGAGNIINNRNGRDYKPFRLEDDVKLIQEFYSALGYKDASVSEPRVNVEENNVEIEVDVKTGKLFTLRDVLVTGNNRVPLETVKKNISVRAGDPYNEVDFITSRRKLQSICRSQGFYDCTVQFVKEFGPDDVLVTFDLREGDRFFFGKTIISGNRLVSINTIKRHIKFSEGEPLDPAKLIQTRQRLLGLGLFSKVEARMVWIRNGKADIHIDVKETRPGRIDFGIGYGEYEGLRSFIEIGYGNLFGDANMGSIRLEASTLWRRYILNYTEPYFLDRDIRSLTYLLREERKQKNIDTGEISYRVIKNSASTGLEKELGKRVSASLYYEYSIVDTYDVKPDIILSKEDAGRLAISSLSPAIYYNALNDPFDPTRGVLVGLNVKDASDFLLSETEFTKATLRASAYTRLAGRIVSAISLGGGLAKGRGETTSLPLVERFYLGGRNTVRGFDQDSLGPVGSNGLAIGGNYFLLGNLEFRIRLAGSWRTVIFGDCGNVWIERANVSTGDLRCSAGVGLRYRTPVGPLRLDYGRKLDRQDGESAGELHFSIGHAF